MRTFTENVLDVVRAIPKGQTRTYAQVAAAAGSPNAARAVGSIMKKNYLPDVPCHRVITSSGAVGNYNRGGAVQKRALLRKEGAVR